MTATRWGAGLLRARTTKRKSARRTWARDSPRCPVPPRTPWAWTCPTCRPRKAPWPRRRRWGPRARETPGPWPWTAATRTSGTRPPSPWLPPGRTCPRCRWKWTGPPAPTNWTSWHWGGLAWRRTVTAAVPAPAAAAAGTTPSRSAGETRMDRRGRRRTWSRCQARVGNTEERASRSATAGGAGGPRMLPPTTSGCTYKCNSAPTTLSGTTWTSPSAGCRPTLTCPSPWRYSCRSPRGWRTSTRWPSFTETSNHPTASSWATAR
mmetsp:Transcript_11008/g.31563  ORF Transcript_11008/g.31563 Transcript_11008/m.31563 type:complete len:264 (-) Transcript_11008:900-1691(-)